jgi:DNA-binding NtrC family response regulator
MRTASDEIPADALHGATLYVEKPQDPRRAKTPPVSRFGALIGASQSMRSVYELIGRVAGTNAGVLLSGETGTGKELVAQTIHSLSRRSEQAFLPLNCGAMSAALIESELFGHERGSFTGADRLHRGYFERANRGTLFLDEICEMPGDLQVRLLRVLETSSVARVGGTEPFKFDVRIIAATNRPPAQAVTAGRLRQDLLYRLNVFPIELPPLRERGRDVVLLAEAFLGDLNLAEETGKRFTATSIERLLRHTWPGNVRELRNLIHRAFILAGEDVEVDCVVPSIGGAGDHESFATGESCAASLVIRTGTSLAQAERRLIVAALAHFGDKQQAALALGISVKTIYNRLREYRVAIASVRTGEIQKVAPFRARRGPRHEASGELNT